MKIIAVGMNYALHNKELGHTLVNKEPVIFMKPDSAILKDGNNFMVFAAQQKLNWNVNCDAIEAAKQHIIATYLAAAAGIDWDDRDHLAALANTDRPAALDCRYISDKPLVKIKLLKAIIYPEHHYFIPDVPSETYFCSLFRLVLSPYLT